MKNTKVTLLIIVTLSLLITIVPAYMVTATDALAGKKVCLDPGHGGSATGALNEDYSLEEKDINLDVAYGLKALLEADGATVVMTRKDDSDKSNNDRYTFCNNEQATILVSIHTNSTSDPTMDGSLALYFHQDDKALAQAIYDVMYPYLKKTAPDPDNFTDFGLDRYASGVLLKSDMPAAMMEPLFMSHPVEADWLTVTLNQVDGDGVVLLDADGNPTLNPDCENFDCRRGQIARALHDGILAYFTPVGTMHVASIDMSLQTRGPWTNAIATVTIIDADGVPVEGATVSGHWSGATSDSDSGVTDADGKVSLKSDRVKDPPSGTTFTFTVDDVVLSRWTYDPSIGETSDSITVP
jgi:N-acetylmuramoyl-L-alanine amidase